MIVFKLTTYTNIDNLNQINKFLPEIYKYELSKLKITSYDDCYDDKVISYFICTKESFDIIKEILSNNSINFLSEDITKDVLFNKVIISDVDFKKALKSYRYDNITVDIVLEKITKYGVDSLSKLDKSLLDLFK